MINTKIAKFHTFVSHPLKTFKSCCFSFRNFRSPLHGPVQLQVTTLNPNIGSCQMRKNSKSQFSSLLLRNGGDCFHVSGECRCPGGWTGEPLYIIWTDELLYILWTGEPLYIIYYMDQKLINE